LVFDNEGQYAEFYERMNSGVYKLSQDTVKKVLEDNKAKMSVGEDINLFPQPVLQLIDSSGKLLKRQGMYDFYGRNRTLG